MTPASLLHFFGALLWCALVFISIAGYGAVLLRLFGVRRPSVALAATSGVGVVIFLGGCLNLIHAITSPIVTILINLGLIAAGLLRITITEPGAPDESASLPRPSSRTITLLLLLLAVLFLVRIGASVRAGQYQASDDYNFYLAAPAKMLQLHHYAADPFSERRIMTSIGGSYFLQTLVLTALPLAHVQMADRTLGLLLLAFMAYGIANQFHLTRTQRLVFALLVIFTPQLQFNLTFVLLPSALFFGLVYLAANRKLFAGHPILLALLLGIVTGAVATTKSTYLPHGVIFVACIALFRWRRRGFSAGAQTLLFAALGALLVMAPWMIAHHATSGTFFYPTLGPGYEYTAYGLYPAPSGAGVSVIVHKVIPFCIPLLFLFLIEWVFGDRDEQGEAILALSAAAFCAALLVGIATGGDSVRRYNYPCMLPALVLLYVVFSRRANSAPAARRWPILQAGTVIFVMLGALTIWGNRLSNELMQIPWGLKSALLDTPIVPPSVQAEYTAVQGAIPADAAALATVDNPFLFDFGTRSISIADYPGAASLPPGWPSRQDGEALARYLLANHLRYLIYDYAYFAAFDREAPHVIADASRTQWIHSEARITLRSHQQYAELAKTRLHLYDDGNIYILDLATPANGSNPALNPVNSSNNP
ncbi:MAG: hypothetical protein JWQ49_4911 [Edaphobacter sp.]|nr:hypothetical protein [Edaphobacter sp.]